MSRARHGSLSKPIHQRTLEGGRRRGRQRKRLGIQRPGVDIPAYARTADDGLLLKGLEQNLYRIVPRVPKGTLAGQRTTVN